MYKRLDKFLKWSCKTASKSTTFAVAVLILLLWSIIGLFTGFTNFWILIINTVATINATLMVFIIQNTQARESKALHLKIDELLRAVTEARNSFIAAEELGNEELDALKDELRHVQRK